jgi:hypothetical protein
MYSSISRLFSELRTSITNFNTNYFYIEFQISPHSIMSSSTRRDVSHDPRETDSRQRMSSRSNRKHTDSHSKKSSTSTEAKIPKIFKSSSSTEKIKLETLYSTNKGSPKVIKSHEDSENSSSKSKSSSEIIFWDSPEVVSCYESM